MERKTLATVATVSSAIGVALWARALKMEADGNISSIKNAWDNAHNKDLQKLHITDPGKAPLSPKEYGTIAQDLDTSSEMLRWEALALELTSVALLIATAWIVFSKKR